jgi:hypothetical protein
METGLDMLATFPLFAPNSAGDDAQRARLTVQAVNQTAPRLRSLIGSLGCRIAMPTEVTGVATSPADLQAADDLKRCFDAYGSDKGTVHDYHLLYGHILSDRNAIRGIFEVGLGTTDPSIVSHMGVKGRPGASLRAFRDFCPHALVFGADVDRQILFEEDRIRTFFLDQTDPATFEQIAEAIPTDLDLFIDDGLHSPHANLATLEFGLGRIKPGGWVVIEDISRRAIVLWECVSALLPDRFRPLLLRARHGVLFAVQRVG